MAFRYAVLHLNIFPRVVTTEPQSYPELALTRPSMS
jgi:hypothetical protein